MKRIICLSIIGLFVFGAVHVTLAQNTKPSVQAVDAGNKVCPVSGEKVDEKIKETYEYQGKIYNFCCSSCIEDFKKDPEKYIKKVEEELKAKDNQKLKKMKMPEEDEMPMGLQGHEEHHH